MYFNSQSVNMVKNIFNFPTYTYIIMSRLYVGIIILVYSTKINWIIQTTRDILLSTGQLRVYIAL